MWLRFLLKAVTDVGFIGRRGGGRQGHRAGAKPGELRSPAWAGVPTRHAESVRHVNRPNRNEIARLQNRLKSRLRAELPAPRCKKYVNRPNRNEIARLQSRLKSRLRAELVVGLFEIHSAFAWASGCAFACGTIRAWLRRSEKYGKKCVAAQLGMPSSGYGVQGDQR